MNFNHSPIWTLISTFGLMSLFAVGGANAAIPRCTGSRSMFSTG